MCYTREPLIHNLKHNHKALRNKNPYAYSPTIYAPDHWRLLQVSVKKPRKMWFGVCNSWYSIWTKFSNQLSEQLNTQYKDLYKWHTFVYFQQSQLQITKDCPVRETHRFVNFFGMLFTPGLMYELYRSLCSMQILTSI